MSPGAPVGLRMTLLAALAACFSLVSSSRAADYPLGRYATVHLATAAEGSDLLTREDGFLKALTPLDMSTRMGVLAGVTKEAFIKHLGKQALDFSPADTRELAAIIKSIGAKFESAGIDGALPAKVTLVKTTGRDEDHAAYCRGPVVLVPVTMLGERERGRGFEDIFIHELFHVISNGHRELRPELYGLLGFTECGEVALPDEIRRWLITNPDSYENNYRIDVLENDEVVSVMPVHLFSNERYRRRSGGTFFAYIETRLLVLDESEGKTTLRTRDGHPVMLDANACREYMRKVARNTRYMLQPEEVLAENFVFYVNNVTRVSDRRIVERLGKLLRDFAAKNAAETPREDAGGQRGESRVTSGRFAIAIAA